jgi:DDE superfamily endonuclease
MDSNPLPMLRLLTLPASWLALLETLRPVFRRSSTFGLFVLLATGLVARTTRRTVVGMLAGAGVAALVSFHCACRFFSQYAWDTDRLGLAIARLIVQRLLPPDAAITAVVDDTLFRRWGKKVHHAFWTHDGAAQGPAKLGRGNRWVIVAIVVRLPFCSHPVCLPILFRLWAGKGTASPVQLAGQMLSQLTKAFPHNDIHLVGDAAYHGRALLVPNTTITTRLPANAALHTPAPPRTGRRGRPAKKGQRLPRLAELAATATWRTATANRYGRADTVQIAQIDCLWYGPFGATPARTVLVREPDTTTGYDLAVFTTDRDSDTERIVERYADRWSIEPANATGKQLLGVGQARNRVPKAVERTVPFGFLVQTLVILWYATCGHHPDDLTSRHAAEPWYPDKTEPAFEDMLHKLRRALIAARISGTTPNRPHPNIIRDYELACAAAAA